MAVFFLALVSLVMYYEAQAHLNCSTPAFQKLYKLGLQIRDLHPKVPRIRDPVESFVNEFKTMKGSENCGHLAHRVLPYQDYPLELVETIKKLPADVRSAVDEFFNELEMQMYISNQNLNPKSKFCKLAYEKVAEVAKKAKPIAKWGSSSGYPDQYFSNMRGFLHLFEQMDKTRCNHVYYIVGSFYYLNNFPYIEKEQYDKIPKENQKMIQDFLRVHRKIMDEMYDLTATQSEAA